MENVDVVRREITAGSSANDITMSPAGTFIAMLSQCYEIMGVEKTKKEESDGNSDENLQGQISSTER